MKASMASDGTLNVIPETPIEEYALSRWLDDWDEKKVAIRIRTPHPNVPGATSSQEITAHEETCGL